MVPTRGHPEASALLLAFLVAVLLALVLVLLTLVLVLLAALALLLLPALIVVLALLALLALLLALLRILLVLVRHRSSPRFSWLDRDNRHFPALFPGNRHPPPGLTETGMEDAMPAGGFWKGYLKLSLVTCPVAMQPATSDSGRLRFHTLNRRTGHRVQRQYVDAVTGKRVADEDQARGYPRGEADHVILEEEELDAVALESTRTIDIQEFVPSDRIGWIWYDRPHFLVPDDKVAEEAFSVIREAMRATSTVGIARLVLYRRERAVMLVPRGKGIILWTLRYGDEVRDEAEYFVGADGSKPDSEALKLVSRLIDSRTAGWDPHLLADPVQDRLLEIIESKRKGKKRVAKAKPEESGDSGKVVSIIDALKRSIAAEKAPSRKR